MSLFAWTLIATAGTDTSRAGFSDEKAAVPGRGAAGGGALPQLLCFGVSGVRRRGEADGRLAQIAVERHPASRMPGVSPLMAHVGTSLLLTRSLCVQAMSAGSEHTCGFDADRKAHDNDSPDP